MNKLMGLTAVVVQLTVGCDCNGQRVSKVESELMVDPTELDFGEVTVETVAELTFSLVNRGARTFRVLSIDLVGEGAGSFTAIAQGETVPAGGALAVKVSFFPQREGAFTAIARVETDATTHAMGLVTLTGRGTARYILTVQPAQLDFGEVPLGTTKTMKLKVKNDGTKPFGLSDRRVEGAWFFATPSGATEVPGKGGEAELEVSYTPDVAGQHRGRLELDPMGVLPVVVPLSGGCESELLISRAAIDFGTIDPTAKKLEAISFENTGCAPLNLKVAFAAGSAAELSLELGAAAIPNWQGAVVPGARVTLAVAFRPLSPTTTYQGQLEVLSDDPVMPRVLVPVTGASSALACNHAAGFTFDGEVRDVDVSPDSIWFVGGFTQLGTASSARIAKTNHACVRSPGFLPGTGFDVSPDMVVATTDGDAVAVGSSSWLKYQGAATARMTWKLNPAGTVHAGWMPPEPMAAAGSNQILGATALGDFIAILTWQSLRVMDLNGTPLFTGTGGVNLHGVGALGRKLVLASRGNATFAGTASPGGVRLLDFTGAPGSPGFGATDATFAQNAGAGANASCGRVVTAPALGRFAVTSTTAWSGTNYSWNNGPNKNQYLFKLNLDGSEVATWAPNVVTDQEPFVCAIDSLDRLYVYGPVSSVGGTPTTRWQLYRLRADGSLDRELGGFNDTVNGCALLGDDRVLVYGKFTQYRSAPAGRVAFVHADGTPY